MISWMQKHRKYLVVTIWVSTIAFVGAGFVGWGAYDFSSRSGGAIAKVGNIKVTNKDLQEKYSKIYNYYNQMMGGTLTKEKAKNLRLQDIALNQLFNDTILLNYAKDLGLSTDDKEVLQEIANIPAFQVDGRFSESRFNSILQSLRTTTKDFKNSIAKSLTIQKLLKALSLSNTPLEEKSLFSALYLQDKLKVKVTSDKAIDLKVSDEEIKKYWEQNKQKYKSSTKYQVDLVKVDASTLKPSEEEIKSFYDSKKFLFKGSDGKILPLEKAKDEVKKKVQLKLAKKEILKKYLKFKSGKIKAEESKTLTQNSLQLPMTKIVKAKVGEFIRAIQTQNGYVCVKLKEIIPPHTLTFEEAKEFAKQDLTSVKKEQALKELAKNSTKDFTNSKETDFITRDDVDKLDFLSRPEAVEFLNYLFSNPSHTGYYIFSDKVVSYKIIEQKLFDKALFEKNKKKIEDGVKNIKQRALQDALIKKLSKKYTIEKYYKTKG